MSAYVVDNRTIDYLVTWAGRRNERHDWGSTTRTLWKTWEEVPESLRYAAQGSAEAGGWRLDLSEVHPSDIGRILLSENVRSVSYRYNEQEPTPLYHFRLITVKMRPDWVVSSCACLGYQSCETPDWKTTIAAAILDAIREDAIDVWTAGAPWGVTHRDIDPGARLAEVTP